MNQTPEISADMLIFIAGIFSMFLIGFTLVICEIIKSMNNDDKP